VNRSASVVGLQHLLSPASAPGAAGGASGSRSAYRAPAVSSSVSSFLAAAAAAGGEAEVGSPFDMLYTEKGFLAFENWYRRLLANSHAASMPAAPRPELGFLWPQVFCPPSALHEHAFAELLRAFAECSESEAVDLFELLDHDFRGMLSVSQVYLAICLLAALGCRQLTKFLYFHSTILFGMLSKGCRFSAAPGRVTWARMLVLLRLLGTPGHLISKVGIDHGMTPLAQLTHDQFLDVIFPIMVELDRGTETGEITVINENDRTGPVRSRMCAVL